LFQEAAKRGITTIVSGMNYATESSSVPAWAYGHMDWKYIRSINRIFGEAPLKQYPHLSIFKLAYYTFVRRIKVVAILNYVEYNKERAMDLLTERLSWQYYGGKHYESIYTRFYQGYILPSKHNIDKRRAHLSALINSGQIDRPDALKEFEENEYMSGGRVREDREYVQKKLSLTEDEFKSILDRENKNFKSYPNSYSLIRLVKLIVNGLRARGLVSR
jgi:hypothetical protein